MGQHAAAGGGLRVATQLPSNLLPDKAASLRSRPVSPLLRVSSKTFGFILPSRLRGPKSGDEALRDARLAASPRGHVGLWCRKTQYELVMTMPGSKKEGGTGHPDFRAMFPGGTGKGGIIFEA